MRLKCAWDCIYFFFVFFEMETKRPNVFVCVSSQCEGGIVAVSHFASLTQSMVVYATTQGKMHGWDLRAKRCVN